MTEPLCIELRDASVPELARAGDAVRDALAHHGVDDRAQFSTMLAVEELVGNVMRHGAAGSMVLVALRIAPEEITLCVEDSSVEFDPTSCPSPRPPATLDEMPVGGRGIEMVRRIARRFSHRRDGGRNIVEVVIGRQPEHDGDPRG